jgi:PPK2 family polyphosphate:nucleotide phosphotransferase
LKDFKTDDSNGFDSIDEANTALKECKKQISKLQDILYAHKKYSVLVILQGMDASGKDSLIKHVFSGVNPQGLTVKSFSTPSAEEFSHDYMWRIMKALPERGHIGVFNRSHYEEVLIARVHPEFLNKQQLPQLPESENEFDNFWNTRFDDIRNFEKYLKNNGIIVLKFFLHISKEEQKRRFLRRIDKSKKNWKFREDDLSERAYWDKYQEVYEDMMHKTSRDNAPWHIIPADEKKYARPIVAEIIKSKLQSLDIDYPKISFKEKRGIIKAKKKLLNEDKVPLKQKKNPSLG